MKNKENKKQRFCSGWAKKGVSVFLALLIMSSFVSSLFAATTEDADLANMEFQCGQAAHTHDETCYAALLVCEEQEDVFEENAEEEAADAPNEDSPVENTDSHEHTDACYQEMLACPLAEHVHTEECRLKAETREWVYENDTVIVRVQLPAGTMMPDTAILSVKAVTAEDDEERYRAYIDAIYEQIVGGDQVIGGVLFYDIAFIVDGEETEPEMPASVFVEYKEEAAFDREEVAMASELLILHMLEDGAAVTAEDVTHTLREVEGLEDGITAMAFSAESFSTYAALLLDTVVPGTYYQRVTEIDSTTAHYLIVSANGAYALTSGTAAPKYSARVDMLPIKGNPGYFFADPDTVTNSMRFVFADPVSSAGQTTTVQNLAGYYISLANTSDILTTSASSNAVYVFGVPKSGQWRIANDSARNVCVANNGVVGSTGFVGNATVNSTTAPGRYNNYQIAYKNLIIYKEVTVELIIPADVLSYGGFGADPDTKPVYPEYVAPAGAQTGAAELSGRDVAYASDPATSQLESLFAGVSADDGKVLADKSVIYGGDDYGAFAPESYSAGVFSVTLSALGQQYQSPTQVTHSVPMDVVFILDLSGSMSENVQGERRAQTMVNALNNTVNYVMAQNEQNRIGVVYFNDTSGAIMGVDRYYVDASGDTSPDYSGAGYRYFQLTRDGSGNYWVSSAPGLRSATDTAKAVTFSKEVKGGTYTQHGIQQAYEMFLQVEDTSCVVGNSETVQRMPLVILLSDGIPTYASSNYTDPHSGPSYGSGVGSGNLIGEDFDIYGGDGLNSHGVMGYYTILSATYFKKMIGIYYDSPAKFGTIGMGINDYNPATGGDPYSEAVPVGIGDDYTRAVLNPTLANLAITRGNSARISFGPELYYLINNIYSKNVIILRNTNDANNNAEANHVLGLTNITIPVLQNPYSAAEYCYTDFAYFGAAYNTSDLTSIFVEIIDESTISIVEYVPIIKDGTALTFSDNLGADMVVQSGFVLRYQGVNYECALFSETTAGGITTQKYWTKDDVRVTNVANKTVSLRDIAITVTTDAAGRQTVRWNIPSNLIPTYRQSTNGTYYVERLPLRLFYQVGPGAGALSGATRKLLYTNAWETGGSAANAVFVPSDDNPYYAAGGGFDTAFGRNKTQNPTETAGSSLTLEREGDAIRMMLGNNGRLVADTNGINVSVEKNWLGADGGPDGTSGKPDVVVTLYRKTTAPGAVPERVPGDDNPQTLNEGNGWSYEWAALPATDSEQLPYVYYVVEEGLQGYDTTYQVNGGAVTGGKSEDAAEAAVDIIIRNRFNPNYCAITVVKEWLDAEGDPLIDTGSLPTIEIVLKQRQGYLFPGEPPPSEGGSLLWLDDVEIGRVELDGANNWQYTWINLLKEETLLPPYEGTMYYYYYLEETRPEGYAVRYSDNNAVTVTNTSASHGIQDGTIIVTNQQLQDHLLPETGGPGIRALVFTGVTVAAGALPVYLLVRHAKKKKRTYNLFR